MSTDDGFEWGAEVLDRRTGKRGRIEASRQSGDHQIGWVVKTGAKLGRLTERFVIRLPVDTERYVVTKAAPRRVRYPGSSIAQFQLVRLASEAFTNVQPGQTVVAEGRVLGKYLRRCEGGYLLDVNGEEFRYEGWEIGEWAGQGVLQIEAGDDYACTRGT